MQFRKNSTWKVFKQKDNCALNLNAFPCRCPSRGRTLSSACGPLAPWPIGPNYPMENDPPTVPCNLYFDPKEWSHRYGDAIYTIEIVHVDIVDNVYATYELEIKWGNHKQTIKKRYSDFYAFKQLMAQQHNIDHQAFPPKTWRTCIAMNFLQTRKMNLGIWLDQALSKNRELSQAAYVRDFLELPPLDE